MPRKRQPTDRGKKRTAPEGIAGLHGEVVERPITDTLELNYMPYAMSVIISRPSRRSTGSSHSHRKLLYTMYQMKLLTGGRTKSANVVGGHHEAQPPRGRGHL